MRRIVVFLALTGMLGTVLGIGAVRARPRLTEAPAAAQEAETDTDTDADTDGAGEPDASADGAATPNEPTTLSVVALSWEVLAPGIVANAGTKSSEESRFAAVALDVSFDVVDDVAGVQTRLGRGGEHEAGADLALIPLPEFVASYERLRALSPEVFTVVAWSRGRGALVGDPDVLRGKHGKKVELAGEKGASETLVGLFALDQAGVAPDAIEIVGPDHKHPGLRAVSRRKSGEVDARKVALSTADATHLVPIVAVAPAGVLKRKRDAVVAWTRVWLEGVQAMREDTPTAARLLAAQTAAPEAVDVIDAMGWLEFTDLREAAAACGLSSRRAATVDALFGRTWGLWRDAGVVATPIPERVPLTAAILAPLALESTPSAAPGPTAGAGTEVVLVHRVDGKRLDASAESELVTRVGLLADIFGRSKLRITVPRDKAAADRIVAHAVQRFGLDAERFEVATTRARGQAAATVEILSL